MTQSKNPNIFRILEKVDLDLSKFYSSQKFAQNANDICECMKQKQIKKEQIEFYQSQKLSIQNTIRTFGNHGFFDQNTETFVKFFSFMVEYIQKILFLLKKEFLCSCKFKMLGDCIVMNHKVEFLREQNQKIFQLYEQKTQQCQKLSQLLKQKNQEKDVGNCCQKSQQTKMQASSQKQISSCIIPLTLRKNQQIQQSRSYLKSCSSSRLSQHQSEIKYTNYSQIEVSRKQYFKQNEAKGKKSKSNIFKKNLI